MLFRSPIRDAGGIVGCPSDAVQEVKAISDYTCLQKAGEGALREFAEWLVSDKNDSIEERVKSAVEYLMNLSDDQLSCGKHEVREDFFYSVQEYETKMTEQCKLESGFIKGNAILLNVENSPEPSILAASTTSMKSCSTAQISLSATPR